MGNKIDCKYVCKEPELDQLYFQSNINPYTLPEQLAMLIKKQQKAKPDPSFAKPVSQVLSLNKKVSEVYYVQSYSLFSNIDQQSDRERELQGIKLDPYYIYSLFAYYDGQWLNGTMHGRGTLYFDNGALFEGLFDKGVINTSEALLIFPNGKFYKGIMTSQKLMEFGELQNFATMADTRQKYYLYLNSPKKNTSLLEQFVQKRKKHQSIRIENSRITDQRNQFSQISSYSKISRPQPSNQISKDSSFNTSQQEVIIMNAKPKSSKAQFPRKHHFRKISATDINFENQSKQKLNTSLKIQRLMSQCSKEKKKIKIVHKRGMSTASDKY